MKGKRTSRNPAGRPPLPPQERMSGELKFRCLPEEEDAVCRAARRAGMSASAYLREWFRRHPPAQVPVPKNMQPGRVALPSEV